MSQIQESDELIYALNVFTLKDSSKIDQVVELIKKGIVTTSSKNPGYLSGRVLQSSDHKTIVNISLWRGGNAQLAVNHQHNEANPAYQEQMQEISMYADFSAMSYQVVFEHQAQQSVVEDSHTIVALFQDLGRGVVQRDRALVERVLADDFNAVGWNARSVNREEYIRVHFAGEHNFVHYEPQDVTVRLYGETAIAFGEYLVNDANLGQGVLHQRFTATALLVNEKWHIVAYQETQVPVAH